MRVWFIFLGISLLAHLLVWNTFVRFRAPLDLTSPKAIEVSIVEKEPSEVEKRVRFNRAVKNLLPPLDMLKPMDSSKATYEGHRDQRVQKEMVAKSMGPDQNRITQARNGSNNGQSQPEKQS